MFLLQETLGHSGQTAERLLMFSFRCSFFYPEWNGGLLSAGSAFAGASVKHFPSIWTHVLLNKISYGLRSASSPTSVRSTAEVREFRRAGQPPYYLPSRCASWVVPVSCQSRLLSKPTLWHISSLRSFRSLDLRITAVPILRLLS